MNAARLAEIKARLAAATPGPWANMPYPFYGEIRACYRFKHIASMPEGDDLPADFEFIANAPEDVADLLAEVERLREALTTISESEVGVGNEDACHFCLRMAHIARAALEVGE